MTSYLRFPNKPRDLRCKQTSLGRRNCFARQKISQVITQQENLLTNRRQFGGRKSVFGVEIEAVGFSPGLVVEHQLKVVSGFVRQQGVAHDWL